MKGSIKILSERGKPFMFWISKKDNIKGFRPCKKMEVRK